MALKPAYFAREAASNIRRNILMALASIVATAVSLVLLGSVLMLYRAVQNITTRWKNDVVINAFIKDDATEAQTTAIRQDIQGYKEVKRIRYVSKKDAYKEFKRMFANRPDLVENVETDTLPASFRVSLVETKSLETVANRIQKLPGIDEVTTAKEEVKKVQTLLSVLYFVVLGASIVLLAAAIVLISNTIRLAIFARRREIAIMKLVGATNWFIRWPFMLEGVVQGVCGGLLAIGVLAVAKLTLVDWVSNKLPFLPVGIDNSWMIVIYVVVTLIGALIAVGGTLFALRRYLEV